jgi:sugar phosphate isomerase/epimerase
VADACSTVVPAALWREAWAEGGLVAPGIPLPELPPPQEQSTPAAAAVSVQALSWQYVDGTGPPPAGAVEAVLDWVAAQPAVGRLDLEDRLLAEVFGGGLARLLAERPAELQKLAAEFDARGIRRGYIGLTVDLAAPLSAASVEAELARCYALIDAAAVLGFGLVRVPGNAVQAELPEAEAWVLVRSKFERAVAYGRARGVAVGLHNHAGRGDAIPATAAGLLAMLEQVPGLQLILDVGNGNFHGCPELESTGQRAPELLYREIAACVHKAAVVRLKFVDCGSGTEQFVDYGRVFDMLRTAPLRWLSIVYYDTVAALPAADALPLCVGEVVRWRQRYPDVGNGEAPGGFKVQL